MYQFIFVRVSYQQCLCLNRCQTKLYLCVCVCVCVCVCASGEDDIHEAYILLISIKVVVTKVTTKSLDIKMYGSF